MISGIFRAIEISSTGLSAQRLKMNVVSENIANAETTHTSQGGPYRRQRVRFSEQGDFSPFGSELRKAGLQLRRTEPEHLVNPARPMSRQENVSVVEAKEFVDPNSTPKRVYDPSHPDADAQGFVAMPDINIVTEMVDMMVASRAYEANITAVDAAKQMAERALNI